MKKSQQKNVSLSQGTITGDHDKYDGYEESDREQPAITAGTDSGSNQRVTIVTEAFNDKPLVARHRLVNTTLTQEIIRSIHALALHTLTPAEWQARNETARESPPCLGGSIAEERAGARKK